MQFGLPTTAVDEKFLLDYLTCSCSGSVVVHLQYSRLVVVTLCDLLDASLGKQSTAFFTPAYLTEAGLSVWRGEA